MTLVYTARPELVEGRAASRARGSTGSPRACPETMGSADWRHEHPAAALGVGCTTDALRVQEVGHPDQKTIVTTGTARGSPRSRCRVRNAPDNATASHMK